MSADNYFLIRKLDDGKYVVSMGFASDEGDPPVRPHHPRFDTLDAAETYAFSEYSEYGVRHGPSTGVSDD